MKKKTLQHRPWLSRPHRWYDQGPHPCWAFRTPPTCHCHNAVEWTTVTFLFTSIVITFYVVLRVLFSVVCFIISPPSSTCWLTADSGGRRLHGTASAPPPLVFPPFIINLIVILVIMVMADNAAKRTSTVWPSCPPPLSPPPSSPLPRLTRPTGRLWSIYINEIISISYWYILEQIRILKLGVKANLSHFPHPTQLPATVIVHTSTSICRSRTYGLSGQISWGRVTI